MRAMSARTREEINQIVIAAIRLGDQKKATFCSINRMVRPEMRHIGTTAGKSPPGVPDGLIDPNQRHVGTLGIRPQRRPLHNRPDSFIAAPAIQEDLYGKYISGDWP